MTIQFNCEICGKSLSTSDDKAGRKAKCPGCGEMLVVPQPEGAIPGGDELPGDVEFGDLPAAPSRKSGSKISCPMCGEKISATATKCEFCGEELDIEPRKGGHAIIETNDVLTSGWNCFKANMGITIGLVIVGGLITGAASIPQSVMNGIAGAMMEQGERDTALILQGVGLLFMPIAYAVQFFISCGQAIGLLAVARGDTPDFGVLFRGGRYFWRCVGASIVFGLMVFAGTLLCVIPGIIVALMFGPFMYALVDEDLPGIDCLWRAKALTQGNKVTLMIISIICLGINLLGALALCVGLVFTVPLTSLMIAVSYCKMSGQRVGG